MILSWVIEALATSFGKRHYSALPTLQLNDMNWTFQPINIIIREREREREREKTKVR